MKRIVTYDINDENTYDKWYEFIKKYKSIKITESTYLIDSELSQTDFEKEIRKAFTKKDNVAYISQNNNEGLFYIKLNY